MEKAAASAPAKESPATLSDAVRAKLSAEEQRLLNRVRWHDRLVSLWAPVTVLALVFLVYLVIVESVVCTYLWLQPVMQGVGLLCFGWWAVLVAARLVLRKWNAARKARYHADEALAEVEHTANKNRAQVKDKAWDELVESTAGLVRAYLSTGDAVTEATKKLDASSEKHLSKFKRGGLIDLGSGFVRALLIALAFRAVLIEPFKIPSGSMYPTLEIGDQIFVNKFIYGVRIPFTNYVPFVLVRPPKRGDVIVFNNPVHPEVDYVKRIVGIPGDRIEFTDDAVVINGTPLAMALEAQRVTYWDQPTYLNEPWGDWIKRWFRDDWSQATETLYRETIDGQQHYVFEDREGRVRAMSRMSERIINVPEGAVFVMGDNRNHSEDSRYGLGNITNRPEFVPYGNIKGKATVIWLALGHDGFLSSIFGGTGIRYDRFYKPVSLCGSEAPIAH